ncbi:MAG: hypothetical protein NTV79_11890, partial [Candidatus Aureabacteria bacterium]|nr:hypothetical protein [Candidatus Auribacterota bacterium]
NILVGRLPVEMAFNFGKGAYRFLFAEEENGNASVMRDVGPLCERAKNSAASQKRPTSRQGRPSANPRRN